MNWETKGFVDYCRRTDPIVGSIASMADIIKIKDLLTFVFDDYSFHFDRFIEKDMIITVKRLASIYYDMKIRINIRMKKDVGKIIKVNNGIELKNVTGKA